MISAVLSQLLLHRILRVPLGYFPHRLYVFENPMYTLPISCICPTNLAISAQNSFAFSRHNFDVPFKWSKSSCFRPSSDVCPIYSTAIIPFVQIILLSYHFIRAISTYILLFSNYLLNIPIIFIYLHQKRNI